MIAGTQAASALPTAASFSHVARHGIARTPALPPKTTWSVGRTQLDSWSILSGGGACYASATATYDDSTNILTVVSNAESTALFHACRARSAFSLFVVENGLPSYREITRDIPTACATGDRTCPQKTNDTFAEAFGPNLTYIVVGGLRVELR